MISEKAIYGVFGAGGLGREVMPVTREYLLLNDITKDLKKDRIFFVESNPKTKSINGYPVISEEEFLESESKSRYFTVAIGNSDKRDTISSNLISKGAKPLTINSDKSLIYTQEPIGKGSIILANTMIMPNVTIGRFFLMHYFSYISHDCTIGKFVTFGPNVSCNGTVDIGDHAYIGSGSVIKQGDSNKPLKIGERAIVGMGSVVIEDVPPNTTVLGNPAKPKKTKNT